MNQVHPKLIPAKKQISKQSYPFIALNKYGIQHGIMNLKVEVEDQNVVMGVTVVSHLSDTNILFWRESIH